MKRFWRYYREYLKLIKPYLGWYVIAWIFTILLLLTFNIAPFFIGSIIDSLTSQPHFSFASIFWIVVVLCLPLVLQPIMFVVKTRIFSAIGKDLSNNLFTKVLSLDYNFYTNRQTGKIVSMILNAVDTVNMFVWQIEWFVFLNTMYVIVPIVLLFIIKPYIGLCVLLLILISWPFITRALKKNVQKRVRLKNVEYERSSQIIDSVSNYETVRIFGHLEKESNEMKKVMERWKIAMNDYQYSFNFIDFFNRGTGILVFVLGALIGMYYYNIGNLTLGSMVVALTYLLQVSDRMYSFIFSLREIVKMLPVAEDLMQLLNQKSDVLESATPVKRTEWEGKISLKNVKFTYGNGKCVLDNLNLEIKPGESVALVGPSGGGKTTLVKLLLRYYDVQEGSIEIDGVNLKDIAFLSMKHIFGVVPQEPTLFNQSISYNIGYALGVDPDSLAEHQGEIEQVSKLARVHDFVASFPEKYGTVVGERGIKLSGGQKQRIAIARVLLNMPKVVIFDEATSMLDSESEKAIKEAFRELSKGKTTIVIAHRLSTIINSDRILVIDEGKIIEQGTHKQLLEKNGLYAKLWNIQSGGFV